MTIDTVRDLTDRAGNTVYRFDPEAHWHVAGYWADDTEAGFLFRMSFWEAIEETAERIGLQAEADIEGASAYADMGDYEDAWNLYTHSERLNVAEINLRRLVRWHELAESGEPSDAERLEGDAAYLHSYAESFSYHNSDRTRLHEIADNLERVARSAENFPPAYRSSSSETVEERLIVSALYSAGLIAGHNGHRVDIYPVEIFECPQGESCEWPTFDQWEEAEMTNSAIEEIQ